MSPVRTVDLANITTKWADAQRCSPAPRHRRRLIMNWIQLLEFKDCLDVGCAQAYLLEELLQKRPVGVYGCDVSDEVIRSNRQRFPRAEFQTIDLARQAWSEGRQFDLVICSEVLEHIDDWQAALANLARMARRYLLITVPSGKVHRIDQYIGHFRHFQGAEVVAALQESGLRLRRLQYWGFPFHSLYKYIINGIAPDKIYISFAEQSYGRGKRVISRLLYWLFFTNDLFNSGAQLLVLAERSDPIDDQGLHRGLDKRGADS